MYSIRNTDYIQRLIPQRKRVFASSELALVWGITNKQTLHMTLYRYQKSGRLFRIASGIYSIVPVEKLNPYEIGCAVAGHLSYVSTESVLSAEGYINQVTRKITLVGKKRKEFTVGNHSFLCRYMSMKFLVNREGIQQYDGYAVADVTRAAADIRRVNPLYYIDGMGRIDHNELRELQQQIGYL
jgi:predicted transcriptional regulator of viral defense system